MIFVVAAAMVIASLATGLFVLEAPDCRAATSFTASPRATFSNASRLAPPPMWMPNSKVRRVTK
ncbi:MAG TPA: hypothetical protein VGL53_24365 [Bryobacteraceae bacterium]